jgi:hypothetical protein
MDGDRPFVRIRVGNAIRLLLTALLVGTGAHAQLPDEDWSFEASYQTQMLYLHSFVNYAYDLEWQYKWEQRQFVGNSLRINTGSVASDELLTDIDINISQPLTEKWRFAGRFTREGFRWQQLLKEQLLVGLERSILDSSAVYLMVNPEYNKESIDIAAGYTFYMDNREQYVRIGVLAEDFQWSTKTDSGGRQDKDPVAVEWAIRLGLGNDWWLYSDGKVGTGFERSFADATLSPEISRHDRRENTAQLRLTQAAQIGKTWSAWIRWYDFNEVQEFRLPGYDYDYSDTVINAAVEHTRLFGERHRLRLLAQFVDQQAESIGFNAHDYDRQDVLAGVFYEYLWPMSGLTLAYMAGQPDINYTAPAPRDSYELGDYRDKVMVGWRYTFSADAQIRVSISHEVAAQGFGGGAIQFQMFF